MTRTFDVEDGSCWYCGHVETAKTIKCKCGCHELEKEAMIAELERDAKEGNL